MRMRVEIQMEIEMDKVCKLKYIYEFESNEPIDTANCGQVIYLIDN